MPFTFYKSKRLRLIFIVYWILLGYIIAALIWWFIALNHQNHQMALLKTMDIPKSHHAYPEELQKVNEYEQRKTAQYIGEGSIFFLLIIAGAVYIFRAVRRQLKSGQQQQNFMMAITHELKTPIAVAKLNLETLQKRKLEPEQQQKLIENTIQEANRLNDLCNNLLLSSQMEAGAYSTTNEEMDLSDLASHCASDFAIRFPRRIFIQDVQKDIFVNGDKIMLQMAINNLIDNAVKYSPKETSVLIALSEKDGQILLSVKDEGKGIEGAEKQKVFDKFYRIGNKATKAAKGTGLGLYLTRKIVQQHKGSIFVTDNIPNGSIFTIELKADK